MEGNQEENRDFIKKRQQFAIGIRRQNRQQIISKRRNLSTSTENATNHGPTTKISYIVDPRFAEYTEKFQRVEFHLQSLPELTLAMSDADIVKQHYGVIGVRKIMSQVEDPPIQPIVDAGIVPKFIELVTQEEFPQLQLEAAWALANVASGTAQQCQSVINKGAIELFIKLLRSPHEGIIEQAVWAIGNIASDSTFNRDSLIRKGAIPALMSIANEAKHSDIIEASLWALSNLCRGKPLPQPEYTREAIVLIAQMLPVVRFKEQESAFTDCCWAISYNFPRGREEYQKIVTKQFLSFLVSKLKERDFALLVPIVRIIGNISKIGDYYIDLLLDNESVLDSFVDLLNFPKKIVRMETCWLLSNIAAGTQRQVSAVMGHQGLVAKLLLLFESDQKDVQRQICYLFSNFTVNGNRQQVFNFYKSVNIIRFYVQALVSEDSKLTRDALENLHAIMELGQELRRTGEQNSFALDLDKLGALPILEELQLHQEKDIYEAVVKIMKDFFEMEQGLTL